jgi:murein DD-endopeptidase MepM/ murein hydrolase activator NlpD
MRASGIARNLGGLALILGLVMSSLPVFAVEGYPQIRFFTNEDILYVQLESQVEYYYLQSKKKTFTVPDLTIYQYKPEKEVDLYAIAAHTNIPYDALATINRVATPGDFKKLKVVLIPSVPGIFVPNTANTDIEQLMRSTRSDGNQSSVALTISINGKKEEFGFFHGQRFTSLERAYFLGIFFKFPLPYGKISSGFGSRSSPIGGHPEIHNGIDIAAPEGTDVFAVREGNVVKSGNDPTYGNYLLIEHSGEYQSFYGHLSKVFALVGQVVSAGTVIGEVGTSGRSTGPHLHFEIRKNGLPVDPTSRIKQGQS